MKIKESTHMVLAIVVILIVYVALLSQFWGTGQMLDKSKEALLEVPTIKTWKDNGTREGYRQLGTIGITKTHTTVLAIGYGVAKGEVSTRYFKNLRYKDNAFEVKPEANYLVHKQEYRCSLNLIWGF